ncbi:MAG: V-type ATPase subunit [Sphingomonadaceae bacterium]
MSLQILRYSRPNAELRGMISRLLTPAQLRGLAASPDLEGVLRLQLGTAYNEMARALLERGASVTDAERSVVTSLVGDYLRAAAILGGAQGRLMVEIGRRLELENLKTIIRAKARGESAEAVRPLLVHLGRLSDLPTEDLLRAEGVEALARVLGWHHYGPVLRAAMPRFAAERSLFPIEVALDLHYYRRLWGAVQELPGQDRRIAEQMMGTRYDALNIEWIMRYRLVYRLPPEVIFNYTLPYGRRVTDEVIRRAALGDAADTVVAALPEPYRSLLSGVPSLPDPLGGAEAILQRHLVAAARSALLGIPFQIGVALAFVGLKEAEVHDLRAILEAKRYGRSAEETVSMLWSLA